MDDLKAEFVAETQEMVEALSSEIVAWEADPADRSRLDAIFRFVHTVKGNCGFFEFPRLEALSHAAEDVLSEMRAGRREPDRQVVNAVLAIIDRVSDITADIASNGSCPEGDDSALIAALHGEAVEEAEQPGDADQLIPRANTSRTVRLPVELLDRVMSGVSDVVLARNELARFMGELDRDNLLRGPFDRLSAVINEVRDGMTRTRMLPLETLFTSLPRMVRDLAGQLGKRVVIETDGGDVELDREMIEVVRDPIMHLLRNAIDHGIEAPDKRTTLGKPESGLIKLAARQSGDKIIIEINDDGGGVNTDRLVAKAISTGMMDAEQAAKLTMEERHMLMCEAGLSTADRVTEISGRGVGMDVVRDNVERIGGSLRIDSVVGRGLRVLLQLPLTLSITPAMTIVVGQHTMGIPHSFIEEIIDSANKDVSFEQMGDAWFAKIRERRMPCVGLNNLLGVEDANTKRRALVVLRLAGGAEFVLTVDKVLAHQELVIKAVSPALLATGLYAGTSLTDDGRPVLLLDVTGIADAAGIDTGIEGRTRGDDKLQREWEEQENRVPAVLFTGLDGTRKALRMSVVSRIEVVEADQLTKSGGRWRVILGDLIVPLAGLDQRPEDGEAIRVLRLGDGNSVLTYACGDDTDVTDLPEDLTPMPGDNEIEAIALIDERPVELLDSHWLFSNFGETRNQDDRPVCRLSAQDSWAQNFLRPVIESAGYRVVDEDDKAEADVAICGDPKESKELPAGQHIVLRKEEASRTKSDKSIYRYDRDGLVAALEAARARKA